jgi:hypothetical protein
MQQDELERLSKAELIKLVLRLQRPQKTSRTSSKPPSTDPKVCRTRDPNKETGTPSDAREIRNVDLAGCQSLPVPSCQLPHFLLVRGYILYHKYAITSAS